MPIHPKSLGEFRAITVFEDITPKLDFVILYRCQSKHVGSLIPSRSYMVHASAVGKQAIMVYLVIKNYNPGPVLWQSSKQKL